MHFSLLFSLAFRDWLFDRATTLCAIIALASMVTPVLILQGVRNGVIETMRDNLLQDPSVLVITPTGSTSKTAYTREDIAKFKELPHVRFVVGRIREIALDVSLHKEGGPLVPLHLEPAAPGEPLFTHHKIPIPADADPPQIALSSVALKKLQAKPGDILTAELGRKNHLGRLETFTLKLAVIAEIPSHISDRTLGFVPYTLLEDIQDYRDDLAVPARGMPGRPRIGDRTYASFRLYATDLEGVASVAQSLADMGIETRCRVREITAIQSLEKALNQVILLLSLAVGAGFVAFTISSTQGILIRKERQLGLLRLFGCRKTAILSYPLVQSVLTALCGCAIGLVACILVGLLIDLTFASQSQGAPLCRLHPIDFLGTTALVLCMSLAASLKAVNKAASIDPSQVLHEV